MNISKLTLGTSQLGQQYGIANTTGKPSERTAFEILDTALHNGINCIDTAPVYGDSEQIIGKYLKFHPTECVVVTKLPHIEQPKGIFHAPLKTIDHWISWSVADLGLTQLPIYLIHDANQIDYVLTQLTVLKLTKLIDKIGVSVYEPKELEEALKYPEIEAFQIPINLFDHRFIPYLPKLKGKMVFARSVFLQGLFFANDKQLPTELARKPLEKLRDLCLEYGYSKFNVHEVAITFVRDLPNITSLVIGAETSTQVLANAKLINSPQMPDSIRNFIMSEFADMPLEIIDPRKWKK